MIALRLLRISLHLFEGLATCALLFPLVGSETQRRLVSRWSHKLLALCGVSVQISYVDGVSVAPRALIVANHVSWLDIFVINTLQPCRFVAKSDIRSWLLIGWLCEKAGTIFISRGRVRDVRHIYQGLVTSLRAGEHVAFFPEGTTAVQGKLLPFHANLFEAAIEAGVPVQPYALCYVGIDGKLHPAAEFVGGMTFMQSVLAILKAGRIMARLTLLPVIQTEQHSHRRELADTSRAAIGRVLEGG